jgi:hypothetical protein
MAPKDQLLREAIADAKVIREAAIQNARMVIEEAFKPQLSSMLSKKLRAEMEEPKAADGHGSAEGGESWTEPVMEDAAPVDSSAIGTGDNKQPSKDASDSTEFGTGNEGDRVVDLSEELDEPSAADGHGSAEGGESMKEPVMESDDEFDMDDVGDEGEEDLDLNAVIRELEADVEDEEPSDEFSFDMGDEGGEDLGAGSEFDMGGEEAPEAFGAEGGEDEFDLGQSNDDDDEEIDLEEMLREMEAEDDATDTEKFAKVEETEKLHTENASLKRDLKEHRQVISYLREKLHEVNMLNAKLLYTNKIFKSTNFDLAQKQRVVETFDRATTLREVKLVYTTLAESLKNNGKKSATKITEGFASRATGGNTAPKSNLLTESAQKQVSEDAEFVARMKKLANIR